MLCFQRNWFRADLCEMARSCSKLQQVDKLCKYAENSTIKVFYWGPLRVCIFSALNAFRRRQGRAAAVYMRARYCFADNPVCKNAAYVPPFPRRRIRVFSSAQAAESR